MKKIKKIFPLLLGIMVLMFGTLTVCAAEPSAQAKADYNAFYQYAIERKIKLPEYQVYDSKYRQLAVMDSAGVYNSNIYAIQGSNIWVFSFGDDGNILYRKVSDMYTDSAFHCHREPYLIATWDISIAGNPDVKVATKDITGFFPHPVVAPATALPAIVRGQTKVILITAVVCLALLVILSVLPKKLPRFLNR